MARLTKAQAVAARDLAEITVVVPEWGDGAEVLLRELDGKARAAFAKSVQAYRAGLDQAEKKVEDVERMFGLVTELLAASLIDPETDKPTLFTAAELAAKNGDVVGRLGEAALRLSKLGAADLKKETENLPGAQSSASTAV